MQQWHNYYFWAVSCLFTFCDSAKNSAGFREIFGDGKFSEGLPYETASSTEDLMILFQEEKKAVKHLKQIKLNENSTNNNGTNLSIIIDKYLNLVDYNE